MMSKITRLYRDADKTVLINSEAGGTVRAIRLSLPRPPQLELIDGYGLPPDDQVFRRKEVPQKLLDIEDLVRQEISNSKAGAKTHSQALLQRYWDIIYSDVEANKKEIKWLNDFWYYSIHGYWFYLDGQPVYITGRHFHYLHTFKINATTGDVSGYPDYYHDRDRVEYLFKKYLRFTHETFTDYDLVSKRAIKRGSRYSLKDTGGLVFFGIVIPKSRRSGNTWRGIHDLWYEATILKREAFGTIVSMDGDNAEVHYEKKLLRAWQAMALCFKPIWKGSNAPPTLTLSAPSSVYVKDTINSKISHTKSARETKNDGDVINVAIYDEEGKSTVQILERWWINKLAQSTGGGAVIKGWCTHPSTVEQLGEYWYEYKQLIEMSDFYSRSNIGQTLSGLALIFFSSYVNLDGFTDCFGKSVREKPTSRQKRLSPNALFSKLDIGSEEYIDGEINTLMERIKYDPKAQTSYMSFIRKHPRSLADCWTSTASSNGFPVVAIKNRILDIERNKAITGESSTFNFRFVEQDNVIKIIKDEKGIWTGSLILPDSLSNKSNTTVIFNPFTHMNERHHKPISMFDFIGSADPYTFLNGTEMKKMGLNNSRSNGGLAFMDIRDYPEKARFVYTLNIRLSSHEAFAEEALKACRYLGSYIYPERNKSVIEPYFIKNGFGGYLLYRINKKTGEKVNDAGFYTGAEEKNNIFSSLATHMSEHLEEEVHIDLLEQWSNIKGKDEMTKYDLLTASGGCLLGLETLSYYRDNRRHNKNLNSTKLNIRSILDKF